jgi:hypothetical protein
MAESRSGATHGGGGFMNIAGLEDVVRLRGDV